MRRLPWSATVLLSSSLAVVAYALWAAAPWAGAFEWSITAATGGLALLSIGAFATRRPGLRIAIAATFFAALLAILIATTFGGVQLLAFNPWHDVRYAIFLASLLALAVGGLALRWFPARWLSFGLALGGLGTSALNMAPYLDLRYPAMWMHAINLAGSLLILANLAGAPVRDAFLRDAAELWRSTDPVVRSLRLAVIAQFAAIPMLLVYAWMQPLVASTAPTAIALAVILAVAVALTVLRKLIGAVTLVVGGLALIAQTAVTLAGAATLDEPHAMWVAFYYTMFWLPAAATAIVAGARIVPRLRALWR